MNYDEMMVRDYGGYIDDDYRGGGGYGGRGRERWDPPFPLNQIVYNIHFMQTFIKSMLWKCLIKWYFTAKL